MYVISKVPSLIRKNTYNFFLVSCVKDIIVTDSFMLTFPLKSRYNDNNRAKDS